MIGEAHSIAPLPNQRIAQSGDHSSNPQCRVSRSRGVLCVAGQPFVIPTLYGRDDERLYLHGSAASRMLRNLASGVRACVSVALVDGLVLARSAFHHSMNYRSVVAFGTARTIDDPLGDQSIAYDLRTLNSGALGRCSRAEREGTESYQRACTFDRGSPAKIDGAYH